MSTRPLSPHIEQTTLPSGIRILTERMPEAHSVSLGCWVGIGGRDEAPEVEGASHFLEHLLFKGTAQRSARAIAEAVDAVGGEMNAFTAKEHTAYYCRLPASSVDLGLDVLTDVLTAPAFGPDEVEAERQVILEELHLSEDEAEDRVHTLAHEAVFPNHPLGREVLGTPESIGAMGRDEIAGFFGDHYRPDNLVLAAAGDVHHDQVVEAARRRFTADGSVARPPRSAPGEPALPLALLRRPTEQAHLVLAWPAFSRHDPDRRALSVLNQVLGGGLSSRLFQEIRERRGLTYSVYSYPCLYHDAGLLLAYAGTGPERIGEVRRLMMAEVEALAADGITEHELGVAAGYLEGSLLLGLEDSGSRMARLAGHMVERGRVIPVDEQVAELRAVTVADVARVTARVLSAPPTVCAVGPVRERDLGF
ncbi:MAG: putative M16-family peptidase [Acidimicrobiales bacterium]|nr:putative M16-family peptidase [Acidimicrobiales bacterium]